MLTSPRGALMVLSLPRVSKKGYTLAGSKAQILLFHGYTGSPYDVRPLAIYLNEQGYSVTAPLLRGHGTSPDDIFGVTAHDWLKDARHALDQLDQNRPIILGGLSMGALIAITLAAQQHKVAGLLLFSPALYLNVVSELTTAAIKTRWVKKDTSLKKISGSDIADPEAKARTPSYKEMPLEGLLEFDKLRTLAYSHTKDLQCPIFMAFGSHDKTIDMHASHDFILHQTKALIFSQYYDRSQHVVTLDFDRERVARDVVWFIDHYLETAS